MILNNVKTDSNLISFHCLVPGVWSRVSGPGCLVHASCELRPIGQTNDFEQCSNQRQLGIISPLVNCSWELRSPREHQAGMDKVY